jgi:xanthine dehydrogenase accessory factor
MSVWIKANELEAKGESFVIVTLLSVRGSAPQDVGAKMIVTNAGLFAGTVGGGKVEAAAIKEACGILENKNQQDPKSLTWNLQKDIGMTCGGEVTYLFEHFPQAAWPIIVFGAGHVSQALTRLLSELNCQVTCIDHRPEWVSKLEGVEAICHEAPESLVKNYPKDAFYISMTQGHSNDVPILKAVFEHAPDTPYVGVIGSKIKGDRIKAELKENGVSDAFLEKLLVPIGLKLGSNHPYEIAISIAAQLLQVRDGLSL